MPKFCCCNIEQHALCCCSCSPSQLHLPMVPFQLPAALRHITSWKQVHGIAGACQAAPLFPRGCPPTLREPRSSSPGSCLRLLPWSRRSQAGWRARHKCTHMRMCTVTCPHMFTGTCRQLAYPTPTPASLARYESGLKLPLLSCLYSIVQRRTGSSLLCLLAPAAVTAFACSLAACLKRVSS